MGSDARKGRAPSAALEMLPAVRHWSATRLAVVLPYYRPGYSTVRVRLMECDTLPALAVTVMV